MIREKWVSREELFEILGADISPPGGINFTRISGLIAGSIPFADAGGHLAEDNAALFWDAAEDNLGIGVNTFSATMTQGIQIGTGLAPTANVANSFAFYSADFAAGNACPHFRTENGTVIGLNQSLLTTDNVTFGTLGCGGPLTITQNSDTLILSHDGSNANIKWSDGDLALMTDEGTNTNTSVAILGKGTGVGVLEVYDTDDDSYITLGWKGDDQPSISCNTTPTEFNFLHLRPIPVKFWSSIISGNPYFYIYGYKTAVGVKYLRQRVEADGDALIQAEGNLTILADGGAISFGNENLVTTGTLGCGALTVNSAFPQVNIIGTGDTIQTFYTPTGGDRYQIGAAIAVNSDFGIRNETDGRNEIMIKGDGTIYMAGGGDLGFGTDTPTGMVGFGRVFHLKGPAADDIAIRIEGQSGIGGSYEIGISSGNLQLYRDASNLTMYLSNAGLVGIGLIPTANMVGLSIEAGCLTLKERATPTADATYGKIYTKDDNLLYFQSGDGVEHQIAYV